MKFYLNSSLSLDDLLQDLKRNAGQVSLILTELESRGAQSNGEELLREYASISRLMKPRHAQPAEDERVVDLSLLPYEIAEELPKTGGEFGKLAAMCKSHVAAFIEKLISARTVQPAASTPTEELRCEHGVLQSMECLNCTEEYIAASTEAQNDE